MYRRLYENEREWIEKILDVEFEGKKILLKQVLNAMVVFEQGYDYISLKFKIEETEKFPYQVRVPVEMRVFQNDSAPIVFLLHILNGYIDELELITADSSKINSKSIQVENVEYIINDKVKEFDIVCNIKKN